MSTICIDNKVIRMLWGILLCNINQNHIYFQIYTNNIIQPDAIKIFNGIKKNLETLYNSSIVKIVQISHSLFGVPNILICNIRCIFKIH